MPLALTKSRPLRAVFCALALGTTALAGLSACNQPAEPTPVKAANTPTPSPEQTAPPDVPQGPYVSPRAGTPIESRHLTDGEKALVRSVFGNTINLDAVRVHLFNPINRRTTEVLDRDPYNIEAYGRNYYRADYSNADDVYLFGNFMHDMTAIWQNQRGERHDFDASITQYHYPLGQWRFDDYGLFQQRAIVEDYSRRFLHEKRESRWIPTRYGADRLDTDPFLQELVEDRLPAAASVRLAKANVVTRPLTAGETALVRAIFGDRIRRIEDIRLHLYPQSYGTIRGGSVGGSVSSGRDIHIYGRDNHFQDYSRVSAAEPFRIFIHEMTHIWQFQNHFNLTGGGQAGNAQHYEYPVEERYRFRDYFSEQQASMVEDYALYYFHPSRNMSFFDREYRGREFDRRLPILTNRVESEFPAARAGRLSGDWRVPRATMQIPEAPAAPAAEPATPAPVRKTEQASASGDVPIVTVVMPDGRRITQPCRRTAPNTFIC